jgi:hypothetical protein
MQYLKQSTASQSLLIGPFLDDADGNTALTSLTISNTDIRLSKNGANIVAKNSGGGTHDEIGYYTITLDATDTNTVGRLQLMVHEAGALPVYHELTVLEEAIYDALIGASATGLLPANVTEVEGGDASDALLAAANAAIVANHLDHLLAVTYDPASKPGAPDALLNELVESDGGVARYTANALEEAPTGGSAPTVGEITADIDANSTQLAAIKVRTDNLPDDPADQSLVIAATNALAALIGSPSVSLAADIAALASTLADILTDTGTTLDDKLDAIQAVTDQFSFGVAGKVDANVTHVNEIEIGGDGQPGTEWGPAA